MKISKVDKLLGKHSNDPMKDLAERESPPIAADDGLPSRPTKQVVDPQSLRILAIAPPGWGKTTFLSKFPDALLLAFEEGHKFVECNKIVIDKWDGKDESVDQDGNMHLSALEAIRRINASDRFKFIIVDTIDAMIKLCVDHHLALYKGQHLSDLGDYGKGYDLGQDKPIRLAINSMLKTGRGMGYITHQAITKKTVKGVEIESRKASMANGVMKIIFPQVDTILHGEFGAVRPIGGKKNTFRDRIIRTEGSEELLAKNRGGIFPPAWIVPSDPQIAWEQFSSFLADSNNIKAASEEFDSIYE